MTYASMKAFMERYFECYGMYSNKVEEIDKLDESYTSHFISTGYTHMQGKEYPLVRKGRNAHKDSPGHYD